MNDLEYEKSQSFKEGYMTGKIVGISIASLVISIIAIAIQIYKIFRG